MVAWQFWTLIVVLTALGADRNWREEKLLKQRLDRMIEILAAIRDRRG
jgi:hypothetical protein